MIAINNEDIELNDSKDKEQMRVLREVMFEWFEIKQIYHQKHKDKTDFFCSR